MVGDFILCGSIGEIMATDTRTPKEIRQAWVAALRSGEFRQGTGAMRKEDGSMCCLGVLYQVVNGRRPRLNLAVPGKKTTMACGLHNCEGRVEKDIVPGLKSLWTANDAGVNFLKIADIIESEPAGMFTDTVKP
jgi:hypothetical protein